MPTLKTITCPCPRAMSLSVPQDMTEAPCAVCRVAITGDAQSKFVDPPATPEEKTAPDETPAAADQNAAADQKVAEGQTTPEEQANPEEQTAAEGAAPKQGE